MKKSFIFTFIMAVVGAIIGAGFVSGKEVVSFFGSWGYFSLFLIALVGVLFFFCFYIFSKLGKNLRPKSISDLTSAMFGKAGVFVDFAFILSSFITLSSMIAGSDSIGQIMFGAGYNFCYISILTVMIVVIVVSVGLKFIYKITDAILPVMLVLILIVSLTFLFGTSRQMVSADNTSGSAFSALIYFVLYVFMNTFSNIFIIAKTSQYMSKKQIGLACGISAGILAFLVGLILITIMHGGNEIFVSDMPMLAVANGTNKTFGMIYAIVLWLAIFTTICVVAYTIVEWLFQYISNKFICSVITLSLGFVFSRFGFSTIVDIFYPIEGIFGGIFIVYSVVYYFKTKKQFLLKEYSKINTGKTAESVEFVPNDVFADARQYEQYLQRSQNLRQNSSNYDKNVKLSTITNKTTRLATNSENKQVISTNSNKSAKTQTKIVKHEKSATSKSKISQNRKKMSKASKMQTKNANSDIFSTKIKNSSKNAQNDDIKSIKVQKTNNGYKITKK